MCGLVGFVGATENPRKIMGNMLGHLVHRGPDGSHIFISEDSKIALGHTRLAIIDLDHKANQPMWNLDKSLALIFNGEIYNHRELRKILESKGHVFLTDHSDTEVVLVGYQEWGPEVVLRLNGMFAFVLFDLKEHALILARDPFGKKPLYYSLKPQGIVFGSSLKSILVHPFLRHSEIDKLAVARFFSYGYIPSPQTCYKDISKLPGGYRATYFIRTNTLVNEPFFQIEDHIHESKISEGGAQKQLSYVLDQAVNRRLEADVPLGFFLSGGIDSSAVVAVASRLRPGKILKTFSIGFKDSSYDESVYAEVVARHFKTEHRKQMIGLEEARSAILTVLDHLDEPMGDPSIVPTYLLAKMAREYVKVSLSGDGGDEMLAGYDPFKALFPARLISRLPNPIKKALAGLGKNLPVPNDKNMPFALKLGRGLRAISRQPSLWNPYWLAPLEPEALNHLIKTEMTGEKVFADSVKLWEKMAEADDIQKTTAWFSKFYLQEGVLAKVDRASMQVALEVRSPFLDHEFANFALSLPSKIKFKNGTGKRILLSILEGTLPDIILKRNKKGFGIPLANWMRCLIQERPQDFLIAGDFWGLEKNYISQKIEEHKNRENNHGHFLWCLFVLSRHIQSTKN